MKNDNLVSIGKHLRSLGKKGELRFRLYTEESKKPFFFKGIP
jgi:ribosomal 30S subunit maturation factor RimM